jgi:hypothetical protein
MFLCNSEGRRQGEVLQANGAEITIISLWEFISVLMVASGNIRGFSPVRIIY